MKDFVKTMLAVICGYFVLRIIGFLFLMVFLISSLAGLGKPALPKNGVLDLDMSTFVVAEQSKDASAPDMMTMSFNMTPLVGLRDAVVAIRTAAEDPGIQYILLRADEASLGVADAEELRAALSSFRESGKAVVAYVENPSNASFYLSTVADKIYMGSHHGGTSQLIGISSQMIFLKDVLDKLGVNVQLIRHGKYKSAGEMFIKSSASPENREQNQVMVNTAWKEVGGTIAKARGLSLEDFNALVDNLDSAPWPGWMTARSWCSSPSPIMWPAARPLFPVAAMWPSCMPMVTSWTGRKTTATWPETVSYRLSTRSGRTKA